jgi:hypothetical protein
MTMTKSTKLSTLSDCLVAFSVSFLLSNSSTFISTLLKLVINSFPLLVLASKELIGLTVNQKTFQMRGTVMTMNLKN